MRDEPLEYDNELLEMYRSAARKLPLVAIGAEQRQQTFPPPKDDGAIRRPRRLIRAKAKVPTVGKVVH